VLEAATCKVRHVRPKSASRRRLPARSALITKLRFDLCGNAGANCNFLLLRCCSRRYLSQIPLFHPPAGGIFPRSPPLASPRPPERWRKFSPWLAEPSTALASVRCGDRIAFDRYGVYPHPLTAGQEGAPWPTPRPASNTLPSSDRRAPPCQSSGRRRPHRHALDLIPHRYTFNDTV
jgi:hypothetical protein